MADNVSPAPTVGGPKTEEGKKRSSMNALKHGLTAKSPQAEDLVSQKGGDEFEEILREMREVYAPKDRLEEMLVRRIAVCLWRLQQTEAISRRRMEGWENIRVLPSYYDEILSCERLVDVHLYRAIRTLLRKRQVETIR